MTTIAERPAPAADAVPESRRRRILLALALAAGLIAYGNLITAYGPGESNWLPHWLTLVNGAAAAFVIWRGWAGVSFVGDRFGWAKQVALGVVAGLALAAVPMLTFVLAPLSGQPVQWSPAAQASPFEFAWRLLVAVPIGVALFEEVMFRGWLNARARQAFGSRGGSITFQLATFTLWHVMVTWTSVSQTQYGAQSWLQSLAYLGALAGIAVGGAAFLALRSWTRGLLAPVVAHWCVNTAMTLLLIAVA